MDEFKLNFDPETVRLTVVGGTRAGDRLDRLVLRVSEVVAQRPGITFRDLKYGLKMVSKEQGDAAIREALRRGLIRREIVGQKHHYYPVPAEKIKVKTAA